MSAFLNRVLAAGLVVMLSAGVALAADEAISDAALDAVRKDMAGKFPNLDSNNINRAPVPGLLEIRQGAMVAYLTGDGRYLMQGELIDLESNVNLTEASVAEGRRELMADVKEGEGITFSPASPEHTVTVFTDIDCTFCRKMHREIEAYNDAGIAVRYLMYPRSGPNTRSWEKAEEVWCADDQLDAMTRAKNDEALPAAECDASIIRSHFQTGLSVGVSGTPTIVLEDGSVIGGYVPASDLAARLSPTE